MNARSIARWQIVAAAVLWSTSGFFSKSLTEATSLGLHEPHLSVWQIAFFRALFSGLALAPTIKGTPFRPRPLVWVLVACFAVLNLSFMTAMTYGTAANAILLQYTAPAWVLFFTWTCLKQRPSSGELLVLIGGLGGIAVILAGTWAGDAWFAIAAALGSGVAYAAVLICLKELSDLPANWLIVLNLLGSALVLLPVVVTQSMPSPAQLAWLAVFGILQFALPYWLMAKALRYTTSLEAGLLTLLEPALNPVWAYLVSPATETPTKWTLIGGGLILGSLAIRYLPGIFNVFRSRPRSHPDHSPPEQGD